MCVRVRQRTVNVAANSDGRAHGLDIALLDQDLPGLVGELLDLVFGQRLALEQVLDPLVEGIDGDVEGSGGHSAGGRGAAAEGRSTQRRRGG